MEDFLMCIKEKWNTPIDMDCRDEHHFDHRIIRADNTILTTEGFLVRKTRILNNEDGQSAIEFILTFSFCIGLTFLFLNQALNVTEGYLVHYVNYMSARTYLTHDSGNDVKVNNLNQAKAKAQEVFNRFPINRDGLDFRVLDSSEGTGLFNGTIIQFERRMSTLPVVGGSDQALFYSESFLGKEPFRITCLQMVCAAMIGDYNTCKSQTEQLSVVLYDNGC